MKKIFAFILPLFLLPFCAFSENVISSKISRVTIFPNRAQVTRRANVKVKEGLNNIALEVKAFNIDKDSVTARIFGSGEILSVQLEPIYLKNQPQDNINKLKQKINKLNINKHKIIDKENVLSKKWEFLNSIVNFSHTQIPADLKTNFPEVGVLKNILSFLDENYKDINEQKETLDEKIKEINSELDVANRDLVSLEGAENKEKRVIDILFNSSRNQNVDIEICYIAYGASWRSLYKAEASNNPEGLNLVMFADITQKTGEDWNGIELNVSNAVPLNGIHLPSANSWFLAVNRRYGEKNRVMIKAMAPASRALQALNTDEALKYEKVGAVSRHRARFAAAKVKELPISFKYKLPQKVNIVSRGKSTLLPIFSKHLKGRFYYYAVPEVSPLVFFVCRAEVNSELLPGNLNVYFNGSYTGKTFLGRKKAGEKFVINLGAVRGVKVREEKIKDKLKETFFGKIERQTIIRDLSFKITAENSKDKTAVVHIVSNIPVSKTDKIKVKNIHLDPSPAKKNYEDKEGVMLWKLKLGPKETRRIKMGYTIMYPKGMSIIGLN